MHKGIKDINDTIRFCLWVTYGPVEEVESDSGPEDGRDGWNHSRWSCRGRCWPCHPPWSAAPPSAASSNCILWAPPYRHSPSLGFPSVTRRLRLQSLPFKEHASNLSSTSTHDAWIMQLNERDDSIRLIKSTWSCSRGDGGRAWRRFDE